MATKTVVIPDIHGKTIWVKILQKENPDQVVFLGDYFDCYENISTTDQIKNFKQIINYAETNQHKKVICLIGNHDFHYLHGVTEQYSGYQESGAFRIKEALEENKKNLQIAYQYDNLIFTHAGVSPLFLDRIFGKENWSKTDFIDKLNIQFKTNYNKFFFNYSIAGDRLQSMYGDNVDQSCIWIRPNSLEKGNYGDERLSGLIQVVGHTKQQEGIKFIGGQFFYTDTFDFTEEYLVIEDNDIKIKSL